MPQGIEVRDAGGNIVFTTNTRLYRLLTLQLSVNANGSVNVPAGQGTITPVVIPRDEAGVNPTVTVSGTTVSWNYGAGTKRTVDILVGAY